MGSALDHADIRGFQNRTSRSDRSLPPTRCALALTSHNVDEDLSGVWRPPACMACLYAPMFSVIAPQTKPASSRATATTALLGPFLAASLR